jgi:hypothetical protein
MLAEDYEVLGFSLRKFVLTPVSYSSYDPNILRSTIFWSTLYFLPWGVKGEYHSHARQYDIFNYVCEEYVKENLRKRRIR